MTDTIFALSSAPGRAAVAVARVSGPGAGAALIALAGPRPPPRRASLRTLRLRGEVIDRALVLWFPGPESFTGEDCAEFYIHGGRAVVQALFAAFEGLGLVPAAPGAFTRRAVEAGKLDLTQAEGIADLVDAETGSQRRQALRQQNGALADLYEGWRAELIRALGRAEAAIDFADDGVEDEEFVVARTGAEEILQQIQTHMDDSGRGEALREGLRLTVLGPPNAGKSSLVNALARRDVAIVTPIPGTTRDVVEARLDLGGYLLLVADTAGIRATDDLIEVEGVRRALAHAREGMTLLLLDGSLADPRAGLPPDMPEPDLIVWNKADLGFAREGLCVSLKTGAGLAALQDTLLDKVRTRLETGQDDAPLLTRPRHRAALKEAVAALSHALLAPASRPELLAEDLRLALRAIGRITGRVDVEEILDTVFRDFCIGK